MGLRAVTLPLPHRFYYAADAMLYSSYQQYTRLYFELYTGMQFSFHGDEPADEDVVCIMNHQCTTDWFLMDILGDMVGAIGRVQYLLKSALRLLPFYGWYFEQHGCIYVNRDWQQDRVTLQNSLQHICDTKRPAWITIFPEGTRFQPGRGAQAGLRGGGSGGGGGAPPPGALAAAAPPLQHVLLPKKKGFVAVVQELRKSDHIRVVYDLTVAYSGASTHVRPAVTCMEAMMDGDVTEAHIHVSRIAIASLPVGDDALGRWLVDRFLAKEKMLAEFYKGEPFPGPRWQQEDRTSTILAHSTLWCGLLGLSMFTKLGRQIYGYQLLFAGAGGCALSYAYLKSAGAPARPPASAV